MSQLSKLLILGGSPQRAGNSAKLAGAVQRSAEVAGTQSLRFVDDFISSFLRDCRTCRLPSGECAIKDRFGSLFSTTSSRQTELFFAHPSPVASPD